MADNKLEALISLAKQRGFIFPAGEIYGGTRSAWDYGPLGVSLKENIKHQWWYYMVTSRQSVEGVDTSIILPPQVWVASKHVTVFNDPLVECLGCHHRYRADNLEEEWELKHEGEKRDISSIPCPACGKIEWTEPRDFNMMLRTNLGPVEDENSLHYLRPETAQGIFVDFLQVLSSSRQKPPFGIANIGKSFRNEITPGNFIFRTREFEQMEMEYFVPPTQDEEWHSYWIEERKRWYTGLGIKEENIRFFEHPKEKLAHYSKRTVDIEYKFGLDSLEWGELEGIANRTNFDLKTHSDSSGRSLSYFDSATGERYFPYVIEPAAGLTRSIMAFLMDAYDEDTAISAEGKAEKRTVLHLDPRLSPVKAAILPLSKKEPLLSLSQNLAQELRLADLNIIFDSAGAIGRRYRRQDEIGTPWCFTVDFDSPEDQSVTVRYRDSMAQERIGISKVKDFVISSLSSLSLTPTEIK